MFNREKITILALSVLLAIVCSTNIASGLIIYVDDDANGLNNGSSWQNAFNDLQLALALTLEGDEIWVAQGVYTPYNGVIQNPDGSDIRPRLETFRLINGLTLLGGFAGINQPNPDERNIQKYQSILSGDLIGNDIDINDPNELRNDPARAENSYHVVTSSGTNETAVLDGFIIKGGNANGSDDSNNCGAGIYNIKGSPTIRNCILTMSSAIKNGGGIFHLHGNLSLANCSFSLNDANGGAGIYFSFEHLPSHPSETDPKNFTLTNCSFTENHAYNGAGIYYDGHCPECYKQRNVILNKCSFIKNQAANGAGIYNINTVNTKLTDCAFIQNTSSESGGGLYAVFSFNGPLQLNNCKFINNTAGDTGGGVYTIHCSGTSISNCLFNSNNAVLGGGCYFSYSSLTIASCTSVWDVAETGSFLYLDGLGSSGNIVNTIAWYHSNPIYFHGQRPVEPPLFVYYSDIQGGWTGNTNIFVDPMFVNDLGPDGIEGTEDDDVRLSPLSPCVDFGDPAAVPEPNVTDLDGNTRIFAGRIDMGAYEFQGKIYVDNDASYDSSGENLIEDGTRNHPFNTIQKAIDMAKDGYVILVLPGTYNRINFKGKKITISGIEGAAIIEAVPNALPDSLIQDTVTFHTGEGPNSVLKNFIIRNSGLGISLDYGSSPKIQNITFVDNIFGVAAYENSNPDISNCIFYNNINGDLFGCQARYSCFKGGTLDKGNFYADPLFVDYVNGDYHLKSQGWRWDELSENWTWDNVTSLCIDTGDPSSPLEQEPLTIPRDPNNLYSENKRINMGAYGGSCQASMPPLGWVPLSNDNTAPTPNSEEWASGGEPKEVPIVTQPGYVSIDRQAETATDNSGYEEYFFDCITNSAFSSAWQTSPSYSVLVGRSGQDLRFRVKSRDLYLNETGWPEAATAKLW